MAESTTAPQKKNRRSTAKSQKLEAARTRLAGQLAAERERERRVLLALEAFVAAGERIAAVDAACDAKVAELEARIARQRELAQEKKRRACREQEVAAFTMHEAGRRVEQVADLLQLRVREARELIAAGRAGSPEPPAGSDTAPRADARRSTPAVDASRGEVGTSDGGVSRAGWPADAAPARSS